MGSQKGNKINVSSPQLGQSADSETDEIRIDGEKLPRKKSHAYVMLNKPKGYVTTMQDEQGRPTNQDILAGTAMPIENFVKAIQKACENADKPVN